MVNTRISAKTARARRLLGSTAIAPWLAFSLVAATSGVAHADAAAPAAATPAAATTDAAAADKDAKKPAATETSQGVEKIVVTAQKRSQDLQKVPESVTAISGKKLKEAGIAGLDDVDQLTPGLTVTNDNPGVLNLTIRGISNFSGASLTASPAAGVYIDEMPVSAFGGAIPQSVFWDAQRVEVLRGPQGTLFGESSMAGTVRIISKKPDATDYFGEIAGQWTTIKGGDNGWSGHLLVNIPVAKDELAIRASVSRQDIVGWVDVPDLNLKDANSGKQNEEHFAARWTPTTQFTVDASYWHQTLDTPSFSQSSPGVLQPSAAFPVFTAIDALDKNKSDVKMTNLTANYDFGPVSLLGTVTHFEQQIELTATLTPFFPGFFGVPGTGNSISNVRLDSTISELRLMSNGDQRFNWTIGLYNKQEDRGQPNSGLDLSIPLFGISHDRSFATAAASIDGSAIFGHGDFDITDTVNIQFGARYYMAETPTKITLETNSILFGYVAGSTQVGVGKSENFTPELGLSWQPMENLMLYTRYAEGFRDGGANFIPPGEPIPASVLPEKIRTYEVGFKSQPTDWMTVNAAAYVNYWRDLQLSSVTPDGLFGYTLNAGKVRSYGGELEVLAKAAEHLNVGLNLATVRSQIQTDVFNGIGALIVKAGNDVPYSPKLQASVFAAYDFPITDGVNGIVSANYSYRSKMFSEITDRQGELNPEYGNLNMRFAAETENWTASLFVNNATDSDATNNRTRRIGALPYVVSNYVQPRTIGVELKYGF